MELDLTQLSNLGVYLYYRTCSKISAFGEAASFKFRQFAAHPIELFIKELLLL